MFVAVDGPNGVGKTSSIAALVQRLEACGWTVRSVRQPSTTALGLFIREAESRYTGLTLAALVVADRIQLMDEVVRPALEAGDVVVTDRHIASTLALQQLDGVGLDLLWELNSEVLKPDLSVVLSAPPEVLAPARRPRPHVQIRAHTRCLGGGMPLLRSGDGAHATQWSPDAGTLDRRLRH